MLSIPPELNLRSPCIFLIVLQAISLVCCVYVLALASSLPAIVAMIFAILYIAPGALGIYRTGTAGQVRLVWILIIVLTVLELIGVTVGVWMYFEDPKSLWTVRTTDKPSINAHNTYVLGGIASWLLIRLLTWGTGSFTTVKGVRLTNRFKENENLSVNDGYGDLDDSLSSDEDDHGSSDLSLSDSMEDDIRGDTAF
eukprot:TRINITY_DN10657_c0_g1_i1.p1 TRINITY_DN10657_c0_g1~~TRINITY_DN10657_c0_g1_i1.p1  ORF type:complete len:197 (-),score=27.09 TRINITY_DN10657_c0_g1_i1:31-621(-)